MPPPAWMSLSKGLGKAIQDVAKLETERHECRVVVHANVYFKACFLKEAPGSGHESQLKDNCR